MGRSVLVAGSLHKHRDMWRKHMYLLDTLLGARLSNEKVQRARRLRFGEEVHVPLRARGLQAAAARAKNTPAWSKQQPWGRHPSFCPNAPCQCARKSNKTPKCTQAR